MWTVPREWENQTVFLIGGGPSAADQDVDRLRGRKVIVINSSCTLVPWADVLYFGDERWWRENKEAVAAFVGRTVSASANGSARTLRLDRVVFGKDESPRLSSNPREVAQRRTSMTAAINLAVHFGARSIVTLGLDGGPSADGRTHHHKPHGWSQRKNCWDEQRSDLGVIAQGLRRLNIPLINCSPGSRVPFWPVTSLAEFLQSERLESVA